MTLLLIAPHPSRNYRSGSVPNLKRQPVPNAERAGDERPALTDARAQNSRFTRGPLHRHVRTHALPQTFASRDLGKLQRHCASIPVVVLRGNLPVSEGHNGYAPDDRVFAASG